VISITVSSLERSYIEYTRMSSPVYQCDQSGCESAHQERSRPTYEYFGVGTPCS